MKCLNAQELFSSYLENEMDAELRTAFEQHLATCPLCEARYDRFHATVMLLEEMPEIETPPAFHGAVMARIEQARRETPRRVKWWDIDWQRVFTLRVPARAVALAAAMVLLMAIIVQLTPLNNITAGWLPGRGGENPGIIPEVEAPQGPLPWGAAPKSEVEYSRADSGLSVNVSVDSESKHSTIYRLRLGPESSEPVNYTVHLLRGGIDEAQTRSRVDSGMISEDRDAVVPVVVTQSNRAKAMVAQVEWNHKGRTFSSYVFMPSEYDPNASEKMAGLSIEKDDIYRIMARISANYGIVILAPGNLDGRQAAVDVKAAGPDTAMASAAKQSGLRWKKLDKSIYVIQR